LPHRTSDAKDEKRVDIERPMLNVNGENEMLDSPVTGGRNLVNVTRVDRMIGARYVT
jgi:hypothetical protein